MRIERVGLEHHGDAALGGIGIGNIAATNQDIAVGHLLKARDHPQQGRLAASRWPDEDHELAAIDGEVEAMDDIDGAEALAHTAQLDIGLGRGFDETHDCALTQTSISPGPRLSHRW
jgi:hypothetical protein